MTSGNTTVGSAVVTGILSTTGFQTGWTVTGDGIPTGTTITSIDSPTQIHISQNATATSPAQFGVLLQFSGYFQPAATLGNLLRSQMHVVALVDRLQTQTKVALASYDTEPLHRIPEPRDSRLAGTVNVTPIAPTESVSRMAEYA